MLLIYGVNILKKKQFDVYFLITVFALLAMGLIMVMSASSEFARYQSYTGGDAYYFIKRQALWAVISVAAMFFFAMFDYHTLGKLSSIILGVTVVLLIAVLIIGSETKGGQRWINLGFIQFQPSEFAKIAVILFFSFTLSNNPKVLNSFKGLGVYLCILGAISGLLMLQPHFSATVLIVLVGVSILFVAGAKISHLMTIAVPVSVLMGALVFTSEYRMNRVTAFLDPFKDKLGDGWQIIQSLYAIGSGGLTGLGLGESRQKFLYIPEPHNDFIFSILCEELGLVGAAFVILLFVVLIWRGIKISMEARDSFGSLTAMGITLLIAYQVIINIAVVTSSMPVTGMALPFFSYGGTSLLIIMSCMGIILNISRQGTGKADMSFTVQKKSKNVKKK